MRIDDLKYNLGRENIASEPREVRLGRRDLGRMLVVNRKKQNQEDSFVKLLPQYVSKGDLIILNKSKRVPGILKGNLSHNNAQVEIQLVEINEEHHASCRIYPMHHIDAGVVVNCQGHRVKIIEVSKEKYQLCRIATDVDIKEILKAVGYPITSFFYSRYWDISYLNPIFSSEEGSIESPLAGLHFTDELMTELKEQGINFGFVTLHSVGSWLPFVEENIEDHQVLEEWCEMSEETASLINLTKSRGNKVIACGSTAMRTIESSATSVGTVSCFQGKTGLYIQPGYNFKIVDHYFTNFHPYKTSLMVLDVAFCGKDLLMKSYKRAQKSQYLFFEFGDAVFYL